MKTEEKAPRGRGKRTAFRILMIAVISVFFGATVYSINARRVVGNAMPMPFGVGLSVILSGSMEPTLSVNDLVIIKAADDYAVDDIVVYQSGSDLVIHRIIEKSDELLTTQGDANNTPDEPVALSAVKGKMIASVPCVGAVVRLLQTTLGKIVVIVLAAFLLTRSRQKERSEGDAELDQIKDEIRRLKALEEQSLAAQQADPEKPAADPPATETDPPAEQVEVPE